MKVLKKILIAVMALTLMVTPVNAATNSVQIKPIKAENVTVGAKAVTYTGKAQNVAADIKVVVDGKTLVAGTDYTVNYSTKTVTNAGVVKVTVTIIGKGHYTGTISKATTFTVNKKAQKLKKKYTVKKKKIKKSKFKIKKYVKGLKGKVTYKVTQKKAKKIIKVSKKGVVTFKKKVKKGTYKIRITAKGNKNYKAVKKTIKIVVK